MKKENKQEMKIKICLDLISALHCKYVRAHSEIWILVNEQGERETDRRMNEQKKNAAPRGSFIFVKR